MRRVLIALAALAVAAPAVAADLNTNQNWPTTTTQSGSLKDPVYQPTKKQTIWDGSFGGFNLSYGWGKNSVSYDIPGTSDTNKRTAKPSGMLGGVNVGYHWRPKDALVIGVIGDFGFSSVDAGDRSVFQSGQNGFPEAQFRSAYGPTFGMVRGKLGWVIKDLVVIHGTLGQAWFAADQFQSAGFLAENRGPKSLTGLVYGAGIEFAITDKTALGIEYLRADFSDFDTQVPLFGVATTGSRFKNSLDQIKVGMLYKF